MPDEIKQKPDARQPEVANKTGGENTVPTTGTATEKPEPPLATLADDLVQLEKLNLMRAVMLRMQGGRHPNSQVDALLKRRLNFQSEDFQGPYAIRLICTLMMIFLLCIILWGIIWLFSTAFELSYFIRLMSTAMATLMAAAAGVAVFHPASVPDEKLVQEAITLRMAELKDLGASLTTEESAGNIASENTSTANSPVNNTETATAIDQTDEVNGESQLDSALPETIETSEVPEQEIGQDQ